MRTEQKTKLKWKIFSKKKKIQMLSYYYINTTHSSQTPTTYNTHAAAARIIFVQYAHKEFTLIQPFFFKKKNVLFCLFKIFTKLNKVELCILHLKWLWKY